MLYIVPSPIGNLADMSFRAVEILKQVDLILAEDTRTSAFLMQHFQVQTPLTPYHQHNEHRVTNHLIDQLLAGTNMALITDAGTPGISDPAYLLVKACIKNNVEITTLPGATAFVPALVNSGLPMHRFSFEGFLPLKKGRHTLLTQLKDDERTLIFYESPVRLVKTLSNFIEYFGAGRSCCVSRELSKKFEENKRGTLQEVHDYFNTKPVKGEIVIVVAGVA
jgi:16S rRNA (cytidine1402-2'-O)-methyltransferase